MSWGNLNRAMQILRHGEVFEKTGGVFGTLADVGKAGFKAVSGASKAGSETLRAAGHKNLAVAARAAPYVAVGYGAKKGYESDPVQRAKYKVQLWNQNRKIRAAQKAQGY